jgi:hypothetical protein
MRSGWEFPTWQESVDDIFGFFIHRPAKINIWKVRERIEEYEYSAILEQA